MFDGTYSTGHRTAAYLLHADFSVRDESTTVIRRGSWDITCKTSELLKDITFNTLLGAGREIA